MFTPNELNRIRHCLDVAADGFRANAKSLRSDEQLPPGHRWMIDEFEKYAAEAQAIVEKIDELAEVPW